MKALHNVTMALPLAAVMLFAQSQTTQTPSTRPDQSSSSQTDRSAQPGQTERSTQPGQADRSGQSGQADRSGQSSSQSGAQSGQSGRPTTQSGSQSGARSGQSSSAQSGTTQADRASSGASMTFTGTIVNAECPQAQALINRTSGSYADRESSSATAQSGAAASTSQSGAGQSASTTARNQKSVYDLQRDVMRRCAAGEKTEDLALLTDDGRFLKLDDAGTTQVKTEAGKNIKNMKVTINGALEGDTLRVQSVTKKTGA